MSERALSFPFTAIVGMDDGKRSLECALVNPHIRAVLLRGGSGTAKTTLARAAAGITDKIIVNCPLNVTEEQLFGGMVVEEAIRTGKAVLQPGLLSRADGNILYIDDVNLMVDILEYTLQFRKEYRQVLRFTIGRYNY